jgi:hypothetical protein
MGIAAILGIVFFAFCLWLGVRIVNRRERWAKRLAIRMAIVIGYTYPLGVGPAMYAMTCGWLPDWARQALVDIYRPIFYASDFRPLGELVDWYVELWLG